MSLLVLTSADFQAQLPFSSQIEDRQIQPFAQLAYRLDLLPLLGHVTLENVNLLAVPTVLEYALDATYAVNALVERRERVYKALVDEPADDVPTWPLATGAIVSAQWAYQPLITLWTQYLKSYWVQQAFARFLSQHGLNISKGGITIPLGAANPTTGGFERPSAAEKASLQASVDTTAEALRSRLTRFLRTENLLYHNDPANGYCYGLDESLIGAWGPLSTAERTAYGSLRDTAARRHTPRVGGI